MKENKLTQNTTITKQDLHNLFLLHENADKLEETISRCSAVIDILDEALARMSDCGTRPADEATIPNVIKVINDYGMNAKTAIRQLESDLSEIHTSTMSRFFVGGAAQ